MPARRPKISASLRSLQFFDEICRRVRVLHILSARVDKVAGNAAGLAVLLEFDPEIRSVSGIFLVLPDRRRSVVIEIDRRVIGSDQGVRRIFLDPRQDGVSFGEEFIELRDVVGFIAGEAKGVAAVFAVRRPFLVFISLIRLAHSPRVTLPRQAAILRNRGLFFDICGPVRAGKS